MNVEGYPTCHKAILKHGFIIGMASVIDIGNNALLLGERRTPFNNQPGNPKISLLRADVNQVVFPGDSVMVPVPANFMSDDEFVVE